MDIDIGHRTIIGAAEIRLRCQKKHSDKTRKLSVHRRSQGVQWVHLHPPGQRKNFFGVIHRENL